MPAFASLNDAPVLRGSIVLPRSGAWSAALVLDTDTAPAGAVVLTTDDGATTYRGTVVRASEVYGRTEVLVVGGAGNLSRVLAPRRYLSVSARLVWADMLTDAGEASSAASDASALARQLSGWTRLRGSAGTAMQRLAAHLGAVWRIGLDGSVRLDADGATQTVKRAGDELLDRSPSDASALYSLSALTLEPGQAIDGRRVSRVVHEIDSQSIRSKVWFDGGL